MCVLVRLFTVAKEVFFKYEKHTTDLYDEAASIMESKTFEGPEATIFFAHKD